MKHFAVFDIRLGRPTASASRRGPDPSLYGGGLDARRIANGILPCAGATLCGSNLLLH